MVSRDGWERDGAERDDVHSLWRHPEGLELSVMSVGDGTWDVVLNSRMMANRDTPDEAIDRVESLMKELDGKG
ncbi:MAG: hypothetical protein ABEJ66_02900 [Candidatus Nanohaloarchaea archaeon]